MESKKCPNCQSLAISKVNGPLVLAFFLFMFGWVMLFIPGIGWVIAPVMLIGSVISIISIPFSKKNSYSCRSCKYSWTEDKVKKEVE